MASAKAFRRDWLPGEAENDSFASAPHNEEPLLSIDLRQMEDVEDHTCLAPSCLVLGKNYVDGDSML